MSTLSRPFRPLVLLGKGGHPRSTPSISRWWSCTCFCDDEGKKTHSTFIFESYGLFSFV